MKDIANFFLKKREERKFNIKSWT